MKDGSKHPCFNVEAKGKYGRVHLPVAPKCNIQCNYCNRKYDCINESRPGVTSAILSPQKAIEYIREVKTIEPDVMVTGIAGPGDPMANAEETLGTLRAINDEYPEMISCLSTNGLNLYPHIDELAELGVTHVTITINAVDPEIGSQIYSWIRFEKRVYRKTKAAKIILDQQLACIPKLKEKGITVKINSIIIPGVNEDHIGEVAKVTKELGADIFNCLPLIPTAETPFEDVEKPSAALIKQVQEDAGVHLELMKHCQRCRADAVGKLGKDNDKCMEKLRSIAFPKDKTTEERPYVAVASYEGLLVNLHLGDADDIHVFKMGDNGYETVERRATPKRGTGSTRWQELGETLKDCSTLLVSGVGPAPLKELKKSGLVVIEMTGLIEEGLNHIYKGSELRTVKKRDMFKCGSDCSGNGLGCG